MPRRSVVLLDALGTLLTLRDPVARLRRVLAERLDVAVTEAEARAGMAAEIAHYRAHIEEGRDGPALAALRARCAEVLRSALPPDPALAALSTGEMTDLLLAALHFDPFPDALAALERARARGVRLVVVSNWDCSLHEVLARTCLGPLLDGVITSAETGARKPQPEIFHRALALAGAASSQAVHVGDSPAEDVAGARAAGIEAVLIVRGGHAGAPAGVRTVAALTELPELTGTPA